MITSKQMERFAMSVHELAIANHVKRDGYTYDYLSLYIGKPADLQAFADDLVIQGKRPHFTSSESVAV